MIRALRRRFLLIAMASLAGTLTLLCLAINLGYNLAPWNITVNTVAPGPLKGKMFSSMPQEQQDSLAAGVPLRRIGELSDVAAAVAYFCREESAFVTGQVLTADGGFIL